jgi:predicted  nucleic acid-binding Zn-ribbon protein
MSRAVEQVWKIVVAAKARAKERIERALAEARRELQRLIDEAAHAQSELDAAQSRHLAHEERIAQLLSDPSGLSPVAYLDLDRYRTPLAQAVDQARASVRRAADAVQAQAQTIEQLGIDVRRADASLDAARDQLRKVIAASQRRIEERADEEAGETATARLFRGG